MAHFTRTRTDSEWTNGGAGEYITVNSDWDSLDSKLFKAISSKGGSYTPTSTIDIGNSGNPASPSIVIKNAFVAYGGKITSRSGSRFVFNTSTRPKLGLNHVGRKRDIITSCIRRHSSRPYTWISVPSMSAVQSIACTVASREATTKIAGSVFSTSTVSSKILIQPTFQLALDVHDGAILAGATITFRVPRVRTAAPITPPQIRIIAIAQDGTILPLKKTDDTSGYVQFTKPTSGDGWYLGGQIQSFTYECDQNNVIDTSQFYYVAQLIEEVGTRTFPEVGTSDGSLVAEQHQSVDIASTVDFTPISGLSFESQTLTDGMRVLLKNQNNMKDNGIYIAHGGTWERAMNAQSMTEFAPHAIVGVGGDGFFAPIQSSQLGQIWQLAHSEPPGNINNGIVYQRRKPYGNIYHAVTCHFEQISDMRFP